MQKSIQDHIDKLDCFTDPIYTIEQTIGHYVKGSKADEYRKVVDAFRNGELSTLDIKLVEEFYNWLVKNVEPLEL